MRAAARTTKRAGSMPWNAQYRLGGWQGKNRRGAGGGGRGGGGCGGGGQGGGGGEVWDHEAGGDETGEGNGQRGHGAARHGAGRDAEGRGEQRVAHGDDARDVEPAGFEGVELQGVIRAGPPGDQGRDGTGPGGGGEQYPAGLDGEPVLAGDGLHPGELAGAAFEVLCDQRGAPEEPEAGGPAPGHDE